MRRKYKCRYFYTHTHTHTHTHTSTLEGGKAGNSKLSVKPFSFNLQLHALTDNPMTTTITKDITVSADMEATLPATETVLYYGENYVVNISIPANVKVLGIKTWENTMIIRYVGVTPGKSYQLTCGWTQDGEGRESEDILSVNSKKYWYSMGSNSGDDGGSSALLFKLVYSSSINQKTPNVTDY